MLICLKKSVKVIDIYFLVISRERRGKKNDEIGLFINPACTFSINKNNLQKYLMYVSHRAYYARSLNKSKKFNISPRMNSITNHETPNITHSIKILFFKVNNIE